MNAPASTGRRRLRIAVLNRIFETQGGGAERYSIALVEQLSRQHEVHVFAQQIDHNAPGVSYHRISTPLRKPRWLNQLWYAWATWRATRSGFDIVHSHENTWHGEVQTVHVLPVKHNLFHGRSGFARALRWIKVATSPRLLTYLWLERQRVKPAPHRCVVVTSESLGAVVGSTYPASREVMAVVTPGVSFPQAPASLDEKRAARAQLGLPADGLCLLFVGNDYRKKGLDTLLKALTALPAEVVLAVVGNPAHIPAFSRQTDAAGLARRVFFLGALPDVTPAYRAADALVHPTLEDTFAMVVLEAMAHGLPVLVSGPVYCGISGLLDDGVNALLLGDPRDAQHLGAALARLTGDESLRAALGEQARVFAARHRWEDVARRQEAIYFACADGLKPPV
ncbi:MAG: glycosyltransferase family 4 protein [Polaromonas sp.]|nr:glycosyltransferase family 4 protein [Polaromonas sp.]